MVQTIPYESNTDEMTPVITTSFSLSVVDELTFSTAKSYGSNINAIPANITLTTYDMVYDLYLNTTLNTASNTTVPVADEATFSVVTMNTTFDTMFDTDSSPSAIYDEDYSDAVMLKMISFTLDADTIFKLNTNTLYTDDADEISFTAVLMTTTLSPSYDIDTEFCAVSVANETTLATIIMTTQVNSPSLLSSTIIPTSVTIISDIIS